ncbi:FAD-binding and (Fe-S)-binding domain-containing protein [uncultured Jannaschia sp.]|uniref:FAD-binding and (Fe-S)-binding domain-containing protein n=1 Tax=uncultured Jannaschia sp. TaxID=293347 RepID=UPI0026220CE5|nr:FAD-binding and (Fe-S)-binding domain-containing protein [uncultured Jannaschia sp.]
MTAQDGAVPVAAEAARITAFLRDLDASGWQGDVLADPGARGAWAVDNSIYRILPGAVVFPRETSDLGLLCRLASKHRVPLVARGGGTGTNGQSLNAGVMADLSRYMRGILDFDPQAMTVTVQPGVVLDQLNAYLAAHEVFFPPSVSTATRATIGGMLATDASGKGSRHHGRTSDHVAALEMVLADGSIHRVRAGAIDESDPDQARIAEMLRAELLPRQELIQTVFPNMNRGLTGYNLKDAVSAGGQVDLIKLLAGSEGTLALTGAITLKVMRKPARSALGLLAYDDFMEALGDVGRLLETDPLAIEILDDRVLALARRDSVWSGLQTAFGDIGPVAAFLVVEFTGQTEAEAAGKLGRLRDLLAREEGSGPVFRTVEDAASVAGIWSLRSQSVGLLGAIEGRRRGIAFVEDCAVPPAALPSFVAGFRAILDARSIEYGMYGHADVGCLHVRPLLDMTDAGDRALIREISDEVATLAKDHGGLLWGEHGRGFRAEYSQMFFGSELYGVLQRIKRAFDPDNLLNPGKLAAPEGMTAPLVRIDEAPIRGASDALIAPDDGARFERALACNGNAACHHWDVAETMCPSYKITRDGSQSPKGRAALMRDWLRLRAVAGARAPETRIAEGALAASLETCLSCRACTSRCPVHVDIPTMKARFLEMRHERRARSARDRLVRVMEPATLLARKMPGLSNAVLGSRAGRAILRRGFGLVDLPRFASRPVEACLPPPDAGAATRGKTVLLSDSFTGVYEVEVPVAAAALLQACGLEVRHAGPVANAKALDVRGYLPARDRVRRAIRRRLADLSEVGPLVGVEPVAVQAWADAAEEEGARPVGIDVLLDRLRKEGCLPCAARPSRFRLLTHCSEQTADPEAPLRWQRIFSAMGHELRVAKVGCCGMAGMFGHEAEHRDMSAGIFDLSWRGELADEAMIPLATGFSCRSQVRRLAGINIRHPAEALLETMT